MNIFIDNTTIISKYFTILSDYCQYNYNKKSIKKPRKFNKFRGLNL